MALPPNISVNGTMHRRKSSKEEDDDNVALAFPASGQSPPKTAPLSQGFNLNGVTDGSTRPMTFNVIRVGKV